MTTKKCTKCEEIKSLSEFHKSTGTKDGYNHRCKICHRAIRREYYRTHKPVRTKKVQKTYRLMSVYGITLNQHKQMYADQNGECAICKKLVAYDDIKTDHDHITGKIRGLLCCRCNMWMAAIDDKGFMKTAIKYVKKG